jgi:hypothetical protein
MGTDVKNVSILTSGTTLGWMWIDTRVQAGAKVAAHAFSLPGKIPLSADRDRGRPNRAQYASDVRLHPTSGDRHSSSARALREAHDVCVRLAHCDSHDARWLRAAGGRRARCGAGIRRRRRAAAALR